MNGLAPVAPITEKPKYPRALALEVARELCAALKPCTERLIVAGSLRRRKREVGDVEILYIPKRGMHRPDGEIFERPGNLANVEISRMELTGVLERRVNSKGSTMFGEMNKLVRHRATGMPVDLFAATEENWWNYLVCRTGGAESNVAICNAAIARGWKWNPYGAGFSRGGPLSGESEERAMKSECEVFQFVALPYLEPWERR